MLEEKNTNKNSNKVGFDPETGRVYYIDAPEKEVKKEDMPTEKELESLKADIDSTTDKINDLLKKAGIEDPTDLEAIKKLKDK